MGVGDNKEEAEESDHHVNDGEDAIDADIWIEVGEVIDGGDEGVPGKEETGAQGKVDDVGKVVRIFRNLARRSSGGSGEEAGRFGIFAGDAH